MKKILCIDLQLFSEGASSASGAEATGTAGAEQAVTGVATGTTNKSRKQKVNPLSDVMYGKQQETVQATTEPAQEDQQIQEDDSQVATDDKKGTETAEETFEDLIKGKYKADFDERVKGILDARFKNSKQNEDTISKLAPVLQLLGQKYGVDANDISKLDIDKLTNTILEDESFYADEALDKGMDVNTLKSIKRMERENEELKRVMQAKQQEEQQREAYGQLLQQAEQVKQFYPNFDLPTEMENPKFGRLVAHGIDARTAYEVVHRDEIQASAMQFAVNKSAQKLSNAVQAGANRPSENGLKSAPAIQTKTDPSKLTRADREEIRRRVARGEKITF